MSTEIFLCIQETRCANCGTKIKPSDWNCPNPDCSTDFHTGKRRQPVYP
jgi:hypothetical protein